MKNKIKIAIVSDVVCPWCIIGYKRLEKAISEMEIEDKVEIEWQPFELNPNMPAKGQNVQEHVAQKYGSSPEQSRRSQTNMTKLGEELGFTFDYFDDMRIVNTRDAHILLDYAKEHDKQTELNLRLIEDFFSKRLDISQREILLEEIKNVGLDVEEAMARLESNNAREEIQNHEAYWQKLGVTAVPTMVFNHKSAVSGAQSVDFYKKVLADMFE